MRYQRAELPLKLDGLAATRKFFAGCMADGDPTRESLWVAHVDDDARCVHVERYPGDETGASFPLRAIIAAAAQHGSAGIVLAHNHPSGDSHPPGSPRHPTSDLRARATGMRRATAPRGTCGREGCDRMTAPEASDRRACRA